MTAFLLRRLAYLATLVVAATIVAYFLAATQLNPRARYEGRNPPPPEASVDAILDELNLNDKVPVLQLTERMRYLHLPRPDAALIQCPALYVELERRGRAPLLEAQFRSVTRLESLTRSHAGVRLATYVVYLASGLRDPAALQR